MPAVFLLHEMKFKSCHEELMRAVACEIPSLFIGKNTIPMVTDDEKGFDVIDSILPKVRRFLCWNHTINAAKMWLRQHGASSTEIPVYISDIRELLHQASACEYECLLEQLKQKWSQPFFSHYMTTLNGKICHVL